MDKFNNRLNPALFEKTNGLWNDLMLNDPWSVGYVTTLIEMKTFDNKEDWELFYYESGKERDVKISRLSVELQNKINDEQYVVKNRSEIYNMSWNLKNLNYNHGRTKQQITKKGAILFKHTQAKGIAISEEDCVEAVRYRTICQTWNGIVIRERNTIRKLKSKFQGLDFVSTNGNFDHKYAVDYEIKNDGNLICGIQIKPKSYLGKSPYLIKAQRANARKNLQYKNEFGKPVFDVISKTNGEIINVDIIKQITNLK